MSDVLEALAGLSKSGNAAALCTIIHTTGSTPRNAGSKMLVFSNGKIVGTIGGGEVENRIIQEALDAVQSGEPRTSTFNLVDPEEGDPGICGGTMQIFIDPLNQAQDLVVVGGGHVGKAVVFLAKWLGFRVVLTDDREDYCSPTAVPGADEYIHCNLEDLPSRHEFSARTAVVMATRNNQVDIHGLPELLSTPAGYIGVVSSRRRWKITEEQLIKFGVKKKELSRIHAPIGLDIHAETPEEIAISILAEIYQTFRGGSGEELSK
jgi:xanthine dehydrogenase accessory factor